MGRAWAPASCLHHALRSLVRPTAAAALLQRTLCFAAHLPMAASRNPPCCPASICPRHCCSYVTGLPDDVTEAEMVETFSKCGVIKEDLEVSSVAWAGVGSLPKCMLCRSGCEGGAAARTGTPHSLAAGLLASLPFCLTSASSPATCTRSHRAGRASRSTATRRLGGPRATAWSHT